MFGLGWGEMIVVGVVALIVVGPKDLPQMFRTLGRFSGKAKGMAREFTSAMNQAANSTGVGDVARDFQNMTSKKALGLDKLDQASRAFEAWDPLKDGDEGEPSLSPERSDAAAKIQAATKIKEAEKRAEAARAALAEAEAEVAAAKPATDAMPSAQSKSEGDA